MRGWEGRADGGLVRNRWTEMALGEMDVVRSIQGAGPTYSRDESHLCLFSTPFALNITHTNKNLQRPLGA